MTKKGERTIKEGFEKWDQLYIYERGKPIEFDFLGNPLVYEWKLVKKIPVSKLRNNTVPTKYFKPNPNSFYAFRFKKDVLDN